MVSVIKMVFNEIIKAKSEGLGYSHQVVRVSFTSFVSVSFPVIHISGHSGLLSAVSPEAVSSEVNSVSYRFLLDR